MSGGFTERATIKYLPRTRIRIRHYWHGLRVPGFLARLFS